MRVLVVKMSSLGDVVHALPAVTDASSQGVQIDWVVEEAFADIPALHPGVSRILPIAWRRWRKNLRASGRERTNFLNELRACDYDCVIDSQGLIKSAIVACLAKGRRFGFSHTSAREPWAAFSYHSRLQVAKAQHAIDRQRQLFAAGLGYKVSGPAYSGLEGTVTGVAQKSRKQVMLLHGTTWASKHWPLTMWQALARQVYADGYEPVVTWGDEQERRDAHLIADAGDATVLARVSIGELTVALASAAAVIGVDSGLCHLSAALGVPTLGLYGATNARLTGCRGQNTQTLGSTVGCAPCLQKTCRQFRGAPPLWLGQPVNPPCFAELTPELVWLRAQRLMEAQ